MLEASRLDFPDPREHLLTRVLPFWARHSVDSDYGGFITHLSRTGKAYDPSAKYLVMQTRMIYSLATGSALGGPQGWLGAAAQGVEFLLGRFRDTEHDGWFWSVTQAGAPVEMAKRMYGHAFVVFALSEYARIARDRRALAAAVHTCALCAHHFWDDAHGGVGEECGRDWSPVARGHTMGTHLHALEALLALNQAAGGNHYGAHIRTVADLVTTRMVDPDLGCGIEHFAADWMPEAEGKRGLVNYGHNLEAAWLLLRVQRADPNPVYRDTARGFLEYVFRFGLDGAHGGIFSHGPRNQPATEREKVWWVQCEALPAFLLGYLEFGDDRYFGAFRNVWDFCLKCLHDPEFGEWYPVAEENGIPREINKGGTWKAAYHVTQALAYASEYLEEMRAPGTACPA